jgi:hypothetical protein
MGGGDHEIKIAASIMTGESKTIEKLSLSESINAHHYLEQRLQANKSGHGKVRGRASQKLSRKETQRTKKKKRLSIQAEALKRNIQTSEAITKTKVIPE